MPTDSADILHLLVEHELALKHLYQACEAVFGRQEELWRSLAAEEQVHADLLRGLSADPDLDRWLGRADRLRAQAITSSLEYVAAQTSRVQQGGLTQLQALAVSKDLEDAFLDRQLLLPPAGGFEGIGAVLEVLRADTERHRLTVAEALETEKRPQSH